MGESKLKGCKREDAVCLKEWGDLFMFVLSKRRVSGGCFFLGLSNDFLPAQGILGFLSLPPSYWFCSWRAVFPIGFA